MGYTICIIIYGLYYLCHNIWTILFVAYDMGYTICVIIYGLYYFWHIIWTVPFVSYYRFQWSHQVSIDLTKSTSISPRVYKSHQVRISSRVSPRWVCPVRSPKIFRLKTLCPSTSLRRSSCPNSCLVEDFSPMNLTISGGRSHDINSICKWQPIITN